MMKGNRRVQTTANQKCLVPRTANDATTVATTRRSYEAGKGGGRKRAWHDDHSPRVFPENEQSQ